MGISIPTGTIQVREIKRKRGVNSVFQFQQVQFKFPDRLSEKPRKHISIPTGTIQVKR